MPSITVRIDEREPGVVQVTADSIDGSYAAFRGNSVSSWWLPIAAAEDLHRQLGEKLREKQ